MKYALPTDDLILVEQPTITASAVDSAYPASNWLEVFNGAATPEKPAKLTTTTGNWVIDFGSAKTVNAVALIFSNFDAGITVTLQWNTANSWGSPAGSQAITIPTVPEDDQTFNAWAALTGAPSYRYWRLNISTANSQALALGRLLLIGTLRSMTNDMLWKEDGSLQETETHEMLPANITALGVEIQVPLTERRRQLVCEIGAADTQMAAIQSLRRATLGGQRPFFCVPFEDRNDAWWVRMEALGSRQHHFHNYGVYPFTLRETLRGVGWP